MSFNPDNFDPYKYRKQASDYNGMVTGVKSSLGSALGKLSSIDSVLSFGKKANDLLTPHVLASTEEVKAEITALQADLSSYAGSISGRAAELDAEELEAYKAYLRMMAERKKKAANKLTDVETTA